MKKNIIFLLASFSIFSCNDSRYTTFDREPNPRLTLLLDDLLLEEEKILPKNFEYQLEYNPQLDEDVKQIALKCLPDSVFNGTFFFHSPPIQYVTIPSVAKGVNNNSKNRVIVSSLFFNKDSTVLVYEYQLKRDTIERDDIFTFIIPRIRKEWIFPKVFKSRIE